jgi:hypothetical protein
MNALGATVMVPIGWSMTCSMQLSMSPTMALCSRSERSRFTAVIWL